MALNSWKFFLLASLAVLILPGHQRLAKDGGLPGAEPHFRRQLLVSTVDGNRHRVLSVGVSVRAARPDAR